MKTPAGGAGSTGVRWPENKTFAFSVFDDPDSATLESTREVYAFLADSGLRTTIGVWPNAFDQRCGPYEGLTCADPEYVKLLGKLKAQGFEIGYHGATLHTSTRVETEAGLTRFEELFGGPPRTMSNHFSSAEGIYWGLDRVTGWWHRTAYNFLTLGRHRGQWRGHQPGDPHFWGDLCQQRIQYVRNFVFSEINTLKACPYMPYRDPLRPYVNYWYASSEAAELPSCLERMAEAAQDRLEREGGACILYVHFGKGFVQGRQLHPRFTELVRRLARKRGWFVPVGTLLDYLLSLRGSGVISDAQRRQLERRWLWDKIRRGSA